MSLRRLPSTPRGAFASRTIAMGVAMGVVACGASKDTESTCANAAASCDDGGSFDVAFDFGGGDGLALQEIVLDPGNATIYIDTAHSPPLPATQTYIAKLQLPSGGQKDVSTEVVLSIDDPALGTFSGPQFTSAPTLPGVPAGQVGGVTTLVHATAEDKGGTAALTIVQLRKSGDHRDFYFEVPYKSAPSPTRDVLKFGTNIKQVDVAFVTDTTGSMGGSVDNFKSNLSTTIIPGLSKAIPSVGVAVVYHDDYPYGGYGTPACTFGGTGLPGDVPEGTISVITTDVPTAQAAANKLEVHCGNDEPESQVAAMYQALTGSGLPWPGGSVAPHTPAPGTSGGVDFRAGSLPVVVETTDAHWHNFKGANAYDFPAPAYEDLTKAYGAAHAKFVGLVDQDGDGPMEEAQALADDTASHLPSSAFGASGGSCPTGISGATTTADGPGGDCRLVFQIEYGSGLSDAVVKAIQAISVGSTFDVTAQPSNDPSNAAGPDGKTVDATKFIKALRAMKEGSPADGCPAHPTKDTDGDGYGDTFLSVTVGTPVCFEVLPQENTTVPPKPQAQFFNAFIDVLGMPGSVELDHRTVLFLVSPKDPTAK
jgi:hypothetical protein